jgi:YD repeat-containing protein
MRGGSDGRAGQIRAPFGQVTKLSYDADRMLAGIEDPLARMEKFRYAPGGLLVERIDAGGGVHAMTYDAGGLLEKDGTAENATFALSSPALGKTEVRSGLGRLETYERRGARGLDETHSVTHEDGTKSTWTNKKDGSSFVTWPDGSTLEVIREADPRLGMLAPYTRSETMKLPSGLTTTATRDWKVETTPEGALVALHGEERTAFGMSTAARSIGPTTCSSVPRARRSPAEATSRRSTTPTASRPSSARRSSRATSRVAS